MFLILFSAVIVLINVYCFIKKKFLYSAIPCVLFLPDYYGFEINDSLPLISVARIIFLFLYLYAYINRRRKVSLKNINLRTVPIEIRCLFGYFFLRIVSNLYYVGKYGQATKTILLIAFEQLFFLISLYVLYPTKEEVLKLIKIIVYVATALFAVGIFESMTYIRPFDALYTISRYTLNEHYVRLGLLRATTTMGLPGTFGNMCILIYPLALYIYEQTKQKRFIAIMVLDILAIIHSGARSDIFFFLFITAMYALMVLVDKRKNNLEFIKNALVVGASILAILIVLSNGNKYLRYYYSTTGLSLLNEIGFDFDLDKGAPEGIDGYGGNDSTGALSRMSQFTGIQHAMAINPLFGQGSGAHNRGEVMYKWNGYWFYYKTFDVGIVEVLVSEGIIGFLGFAFFFASWIILLLKSRLKIKNYLSGKIILLLFPTYLMITLSTANMYAFLMLYYALTFWFRETDMIDVHY